jgi:hypothetical protein
MDLKELRGQWSEVLDALERRDRMAWIVFFDARLAQLDGNTLKLDFSDANKFASGFDYSDIRDQHKRALAECIKDVFGIELEIASS